jgi:hypothetical protein
MAAILPLIVFGGKPSLRQTARRTAFAIGPFRRDVETEIQKRVLALAPRIWAVKRLLLALVAPDILDAAQVHILSSDLCRELACD